jgi:hypothetical protein
MDNHGRHASRASLAAVLLLAASAYAQESGRLKDPAAARQLSDQMMQRIASGDIEGGLRLAQPYVVIPDAELQAMIDQAKIQAPIMAQRFGKSVGYEFIREERAGEHLLHTLYINRFERHMTRWNFYFYRTSTGWVLNTFQFDDSIRDVFRPTG